MILGFKGKNSKCSQAWVLWPENLSVIVSLGYQVNADLSIFLISLAGEQELNKNIELWSNVEENLVLIFLIISI